MPANTSIEGLSRYFLMAVNRSVADRKALVQDIDQFLQQSVYQPWVIALAMATKEILSDSPQIQAATLESLNFIYKSLPQFANFLLAQIAKSKNDSALFVIHHAKINLLYLLQELEALAWQRQADSHEFQLPSYTSPVQNLFDCIAGSIDIEEKITEFTHEKDLRKQLDALHVLGYLAKHFDSRNMAAVWPQLLLALFSSYMPEKFGAIIMLFNLTLSPLQQNQLNQRLMQHFAAIPPAMLASIPPIELFKLYYLSGKAGKPVDSKALIGSQTHPGAIKKYLLHYDYHTKPEDNLVVKEVCDQLEPELVVQLFHQLLDSQLQYQDKRKLALILSLGKKISHEQLGELPLKIIRSLQNPNAATLAIEMLISIRHALTDAELNKFAGLLWQKLLIASFGLNASIETSIAIAKTFFNLPGIPKLQEGLPGHLCSLLSNFFITPSDEYLRTGRETRLREFRNGWYSELDQHYVLMSLCGDAQAYAGWAAEGFWDRLFAATIKAFTILQTQSDIFKLDASIRAGLRETLVAPYSPALGVAVHKLLFANTNAELAAEDLAFIVKAKPNVVSHEIIQHLLQHVHPLSIPKEIYLLIIQADCEVVKDPSMDAIQEQFELSRLLMAKDEEFPNKLDYLCTIFADYRQKLFPHILFIQIISSPAVELSEPQKQFYKELLALQKRKDQTLSFMLYQFAPKFLDVQFELEADLAKFVPKPNRSYIDVLLFITKQTSNIQIQCKYAAIFMNEVCSRINDINTLNHAVVTFKNYCFLLGHHPNYMFSTTQPPQKLPEIWVTCLNILNKKRERLALTQLPAQQQRALVL